MFKIAAKMFMIAKGWRYDVDIIKPFDKCLLIVAPHTSAWDFIIGKAAFILEDIPAKIAIKKEAFFFPAGIILRILGGLPIDRNPKNKSSKEHLSIVDAIVNIIKHNKRIAMIITPEGTRGKTNRWKTGFYYVALEAEIPIALGYLNFETKEAIIDKLIHPSGDIDKDMRLIMDYYKDKIHLGKYPNRCTLDERWS